MEFEYIFFGWLAIGHVVTLILHFLLGEDTMLRSQSDEFSKAEFSMGKWFFTSLIWPVFAAFMLYMLISSYFQNRENKREDAKNKREDEKNKRERKRRNEEGKKKDLERKKRLEKEKEEERVEVLKNPSVTFKRFKTGDTTALDYNNLIAICENLHNLDKGNSDEIVEIVREAFLAISDKKWSSTNKSKYEKKLMKELEKLSNG